MPLPALDLRRSTALTLSAALLGSVGGMALSSLPASAATKPAWTKNCTALNKKYPHGVGKSGAKDKTSGRAVTTFTKSNTAFRTAMANNKGLDRDKDGVACEKA